MLKLPSFVGLVFMVSFQVFSVPHVSPKLGLTLVAL